MQYSLVFITTLCIATVCSAGLDTQHWAERSVRASIKTGVHRTLQERVHLPVEIRSEIEDIIVSRLSDYVVTQINQFNGIIEGSFTITKEFVTSAVKAASTRTRWPTEQIIYHLQSAVAEAEKKISDLYPSKGLLVSANSNARISELNLEQIIADVVSQLMQDESFLALIHWLDTLPGAIHGIAEELFANKTFSEIFAMLSSRSDQVMQGFVQGIVAGEAPLPSHVADPIGKQTTSSQSTLGIVEAGLKEARSLLELVSKTYHKVLSNHVKELNDMVIGYQKEAPYIPKEVMEFIGKSAVQMMRIQHK